MSKRSWSCLLKKGFAKPLKCYQLFRSLLKMVNNEEKLEILSIIKIES